LKSSWSRFVGWIFGLCHFSHIGCWGPGPGSLPFFHHIGCSGPGPGRFPFLSLTSAAGTGPRQFAISLTSPAGTGPRQVVGVCASDGRIECPVSMGLPVQSHGLCEQTTVCEGPTSTSPSSPMVTLTLGQGRRASCHARPTQSWVHRSPARPRHKGRRLRNGKTGSYIEAWPLSLPRENTTTLGRARQKTPHHQPCCFSQKSMSKPKAFWKLHRT
jgi:hypothetical protein